ncbi:MAG: type II CRISPR RNA-guided endonuclease Cas9 [Alphaproteobacteria bacterium]|nr:type II CRISPR RNA-guided endonuclease Cas9 [Alphaproteobacteria bacterium]
MNYRLGIDLGTSSLGWCCLKTENSEVVDILDMGVRIFPDGRNDKSKDPLCVARRDARSSRTRLKRFKQRQRQLINHLQQSGLLPANTADLKKLEGLNPYELRAIAVYKKISPYELGRAIFHINQRRGFLSNRQEERNKNNTKTQKAMDNLQDRINECNCSTLGEFLFKSGHYRFKNETDTNGNLKVDADTLYPNRQMYQDEFEKIWAKQKEFYPDILTNDLKKKIQNDIFYQRPLRRQETGFCWLEPEERRCPKAYVIAQQFRIMSDITNLRIGYPYDRALEKAEREILFEFLDNPPANSYDKEYYIPWEKILQCLHLDGNVALNLMKTYKKGLLCNITNAISGDEQSFGYLWHKFPTDVKDRIVYDLQDYSLKDEETEAKLLKICPELNKFQINAILDKSLYLPDGYMNFSAKAMQKLVNDMQLCGSDVETAIENVYHKTTADAGYFEEKEKLPPYQELFTESLIGGNKDKYDKELDYDNYMGRITNVSVHIALNQLRAVVNELIEKYGKPDGITIELGRELTKGKKALADIDKKHRENEKINNEAKTEIRKAGFAISLFNIEKYKVWLNCNRQDLYTGKNIELSDLFTEKYEIEHILPYSWSYDDTYDNKIITRANINRRKSNQLPYDFFSDEQQLKAVAKNDEEFAEMFLDNVTERAKDIDKLRGNFRKTFNFKAIKWRFSKNAREIFNKNNKNMARDLTDMQYMSKLAKKYLTCICSPDKIVSAKGAMTDLLKSIWDITDTLPEDYRLWEPQKWQKEDILDWQKKKIGRENVALTDDEINKLAQKSVDEMDNDTIHNMTLVGKDRTVHYHHALDAFVLANISTRIVQIISPKALANEVEILSEQHNKTLYEIQKSILKSRISYKPYEKFNKEDLSLRLRDIIISYKNPIDKLKSIIKKAEKYGKNLSNFSFAPICEDTAFSIKQILKISGNDMDIEFSVHKKEGKCNEKHKLSTMVPIFRTREQKREFLNMYPQWLRAVARKKNMSKDEYTVIEQNFISTFTKDKAFKWYASAGNYGAQIYQINKNDKFSPNKNEEWSLEIMPNYYAFERRGKFFWKDIYPTAKLITCLKINDVVEATFGRDDKLESGFSKIKNWVKLQFVNHQDKQKLKLLFRVKKMSGGNIYLRPLHVAQEDNGDVKSWACSVGKFKLYKCRKVCVTPTGKILRG